MTQTQTKLFTFDEFIEWYPENSQVRYELHNGVIVEMPKPTGTHSNVAGFIVGILFIEILRLQLPYSIPKECVVNIEDRCKQMFEDGYLGDYEAGLFLQSLLQHIE